MFLLTNLCWLAIVYTIGIGIVNGKDRSLPEPTGYGYLVDTLYKCNHVTSAKQPIVKYRQRFVLGFNKSIDRVARIVDALNDYKTKENMGLESNDDESQTLTTYCQYDQDSVYYAFAQDGNFQPDQEEIKQRISNKQPLFTKENVLNNHCVEG